MNGCKDCGKPLSTRNFVGLCRGCCGKASGAARRKHTDKWCLVCGVKVSRFGANSLCRTHFITERLQSPEANAKRTEGIRRHCAANRDRKRAVLKANVRKAMTRPEIRAAFAERARKIQPLGAAASQTPAAISKRAATRAANIAKRQPQPKRPMTFEEQLQAVAEGRARVVDKWQPPAREYDYTLGGVSEL